ncbi:hypothetical protein ACN47E_009322 [Coniothyrium glycines]
MSFGVSVGDVLKLCEIARRVYRNCRDCSGEYKALATEARSLTNVLDDIHDKFAKIPENKRQQLVDACDPCLDVLDEVDKLLLHYNGLDTKSKRAWDRLKWDPETSKTLRAKLSSSVVILSAFYTSLIHDSQVLVLEALERLERDYRGGHREESIASLERLTACDGEDEDDDAAWTQILRDLEDVGVTQQEAVSYRDLIVDWLVSAVNEGRLLEQPSNSNNVSPLMTQELEEAISSPGPALMHSPTGSRVFPPVHPHQRSQTVPLPASIPMERPPLSAHISLDERMSTLSLPVSSGSRDSLVTPGTTETDTYSLYAHPMLSSRTDLQIRGGQVARGDNVFGSRSTVEHPGILQSTSASSPLSGSRVEVIATSSTSPASNEEPFNVSPTLSLPPPGYYDQNISIAADLDWTARQIIAAWSRRDFTTAERHLEEQLTAVEHGHTIISGIQPDRRILRHLIGVCASFTGNFTKAKRLFESVFNGIFLNRDNIDEGDIAAARWLGDVCLHLREHHNAMLAYSVAFEGAIGRFGSARDTTRRMHDELLVLDHWLFAFKRIEHSFRQLNMDPTDIFSSTHAMEKNNLLTSVRMRLYDGPHAPDDRVRGPPLNQFSTPYISIGLRPKLELALAEGFLMGPLLSLSTWPFAWDPTFSPMDTVKLYRYMNAIRVASFISPLTDRQIPRNSFGDSKNLHYVTKKGRHWLVETVKQGLEDLGIRHTEHARNTSIICCLNQHHGGFAFTQGMEICFRKLPFRDIYGIAISEVKWATRHFTPAMSTDTTHFRDLLRGILETAEKEPTNVTSASSMRNEIITEYAPTSPLSPGEKRPMYG